MMQRRLKSLEDTFKALAQQPDEEGGEELHHPPHMDCDRQENLQRDVSALDRQEPPEKAQVAPVRSLGPVDPNPRMRGVEPHREGRQRRTASHAQGPEREMPSDTLPNRR